MTWQVLLNLLSNGVKFTQAGEVAVSVRALSPNERGAVASGDAVELHWTVRDTGIGIPANGMDRLFRSFSQVDASAARHYGGTGLGLAISKRLVELMGGRIWVESEVGVGSAFHFTVGTREASASEHRTGARSAGRRAHVVDRSLAARVPLQLLLAEDNVVNQKVAIRILEKMGYRIDVAANGLAVLDALRRRPYDAILMDVQMPEMDGLETARQIRGEWPAGSQPRIIAMTANAMQGDREAYLAAGMDDYVSKPIRIHELQSALERCAAAGVDRSRLAPSATELAS